MLIYKLQSREKLVALLGFMSTIGRKMKDEFSEWLTCCTNFIIPDHAGLGEANQMAVFHERFRSAVWSRAFIVKSLWYVTASVPRPSSIWKRIRTLLTMDMSWGVTLALGMGFMDLVAGVIAAIIPMPLKVCMPSRQRKLWSTLSAAYWMSSTEKPEMSVLV
jgi:hypothetical protein